MTQVAITRAPDQFRPGASAGVATPTCCCCSCVGTTIGAAVVLPMQLSASLRQEAAESAPGGAAWAAGPPGAVPGTVPVGALAGTPSRARLVVGAAVAVLALPAGVLLASTAGEAVPSGPVDPGGVWLAMVAVISLLLVLLGALVAGLRRGRSYARLTALHVLLSVLFVVELVATIVVIFTVLGWPLVVAAALGSALLLGWLFRRGLAPRHPSVPPVPPPGPPGPTGPSWPAGPARPLPPHDPAQRGPW